MSLYFQTKLRSDGKPIPDILQPHPSSGLAACGWASNRVNISTEDGQLVAWINRNTQPTSLAWHPVKKILVVGWKDGALSVWTDEDPQNPVTTPGAAHDNLAVQTMVWSNNGSYLLTASKGCNVVLWQLEGPIKLSNIWSVKSDLPIVQAVHLNTVAKKIGGGPSSDGDDEIAFAVSNGTNNVSLLDDSQQIAPLITLEKDQQVSGLLWDGEARNIVTLTNALMIAVHHVDLDMKVSTTLRRKISVPSNIGEFATKMIWATPNIAALCCGDDKIRLFSIAAEVIYILPCAVPQITSIAANLSKKMLVAGSVDGRALLFRFSGRQNSADAEDWSLMNATSEVGKSIDAIRILSGGDVAFTQDASYVTLQETQRKRKWFGNASAYQVSAESVLVETTNGSKCTVKVPNHVRELDLCYPNLAVWTGSSIVIYTITEATGASTAVNTLDCGTSCFALHPDGIIRARDNRLSFDNLQLQNNTTLAFTEAEGTPQLLDVQGDHLVCVTNKKMLKVVKITTRELRAKGPSRPIFANEPEINVVRARINSMGTRVALLTTLGAAAKAPDTRLWVFEVETDRMSCYDFKDVHEIPRYVTWNIPAPNSNVMGELEPLLLACETKRVGSKPVKKDATPSSLDHSSLEEEGGDDDSDNNLATLFATPTGVVLHNSVPLKTSSALVGLTVPNMFLANAKAVEGTAAGDAQTFGLESKRLRDFEGLVSDTDPAVRDALMKFGYHTTTGNMDEAYRAVKTIKDASVWQNLARMCVTTKRLDVAEVCLANMQDGVAARALREAKDEPEVDTRLGILAASLGMKDEAEKLFRRAKRFDMVTELLLACGSWEAAQKHADQQDRIRIRPVAYRYAQWMESINDFNAAVTYYQKASCGGSDVPRLYFLHNRLDDLKAMVFNGSKDENRSPQEKANQKDLTIWWAQYMERSGNLSEALKCYELAEDTYNTVRMLTMQSPPQIDRAVELVMNGGGASDKPGAKLSSCVGAAYFIGLYHEQQNNVAKALQFYAMAQATRRAIQLAKTNELYGEVVAIVLKSEDKQIALDCAAWFESRGVYDKAVQLFQKGGDVQRAIDVCIRGGLYDVLNQISETLDQGADPETFIQMAEHFLTSSHFDKAAQMLVFAKAYNEALQLCVDKNVKLTDDMAEAMTLPKSENEEDEAYRISLLKKIAKVAKDQESWHLACKKYTQAGERVKAMKMLLRAGDTEKVIFFANHSRNNEIYVLAGNYLQSQDWQKDTTIYKNIVTFYTKAKAFENLASFYDAYSQVQIDECRDYDNALGALREALKALEKGDGSVSKRNHFSQRIQIVELFVNARRMIQPGKPCLEMVQICTDLITRSRPDHPDHELIEISIRVGDVYALLVEYYDKLGQAENAYSLMDRMRQQEIELSFFLDQGLVERICKSVGRDAKAMLAPIQATNFHAPHVNRPALDEDENFQEEEI